MAEITAQQFSQFLRLSSPSGFRAEFNDPLSADYVGDLLGEDALTGLDSPQIRSSFYENVQADGALAPQFFATTRPVTFTATIRGSSIAQRNDRAAKLQKCLADSLKADATLTFTPTSAGATREQRLLLRYTEPLRIKGGWVKTAFWGMTAAWPFIESAAAATSGIIETATNVTCTNEGWSPAYPHLIRVWGPGTSPNIRNTTTGKNLKLLGAVIAAGSDFRIDMKNRLVYQGTVPPDPGSPNNLYSYIDFPTNADFWFLQPGANTVRLEWASGSTTASEMTVDWRHTWL